MRCCQPPAATLRVFEANCRCFYFCCAFLPSFLRWGLPAEYLRFNQCLTLQSGRLNGIPISVPP
ncbi:hypothetical protein FOC1_g10008706 [Fusarium oxysporum f. sp. cubense race 1]|uniref:Uncharacterized protein n=1 Tax=Fusarium oxysporum f. sp. cubense (strain race 1) TaxID=1229664 RepID=N4USX8_FUSC1|nr:hypothetical protein FOC1_g10008706 [Fusarium oxysporum f. sp. cubense race 1]